MEQTSSSPSSPGVAPAGRAGRRQPSTAGRGRVAAIARAAGRPCSRPSCDTPAAATLLFSYDEQVARVVELLDEREPQAYDLCGPHADRTSPPRGWELRDTRAPREDAPRRLDDEETVAVLAAALRGEPVPTRVTVIEGEARPEEPAVWTDVVEAAEVEAEDADQTGGGVLDAIDEVFSDPDDDPLRAALEEVQRVVEPDPDAPVAPATPLRSDDDLTLW